MEGGTPSIRNFFELAQTSFIPTLQSVDKSQVTPTLVLSEFVKTFFGQFRYETKANKRVANKPAAKNHRFVAESRAKPASPISVSFEVVLGSRRSLRVLSSVQDVNSSRQIQ